MKSLHVVVCLIAMGSFVYSADAKDFTAIYSEQAIKSAKKIYEKNLISIWTEDLIVKLPASYRENASAISLNLPLYGKRAEPIEYYAKPREREVTIPIFSVKFYDDICIAYAYMAKHKCDSGVISDYVGMLRYQDPDNLPNRRFPPPLGALGLPPNPLDDSWVYKTSGNSLKSSIYFLMAHEMAHVLYSHRSYDLITAVEAQAQEIQADGFALEIMARIGVPPAAMAFFFSVASRFEAAPGDFATLSGFENYLRRHSTHPLTSERLNKVASHIRKNAEAFIRLEKAISKAQMIKIAQDIEKIAQTLNDRAIREYQRHRSLSMNWNQIASTCR
jgi:hypothetical protein